MSGYVIGAFFLGLLVGEGALMGWLYVKKDNKCHDCVLAIEADERLHGKSIRPPKGGSGVSPAPAQRIEIRHYYDEEHLHDEERLLTKYEDLPKRERMLRRGY